jgi:hypothetical protein
MRRLVVASALALLCAGAAHAAGDDVIEPDRPDVAFGARTVGRGRVQLETGLLWSRTRLAGEPTERRLGAEATLRGGLTERLELRVEGEPIVHLRGDEDVTDVGDIVVAAKWTFFEPLGESAWPALAFLPFVKLPTAPEPIGTGKTDFGLLLLATFDLPAQLTLDVNAGLAAVGQTRPGGHLLQALAAASLSREVVGDVTAFGELFYGSREERKGRDQIGVDAGVVWRVRRDVALDAAVGTSLHGRLPDVSVRAGGSVRFGR